MEPQIIQIKLDSKVLAEATMKYVMKEIHKKPLEEDLLMDISEIERRFHFHKSTEKQLERHEIIRNLALVYARQLNELCPDSRELSLALTHLEECVMFANAAIARNG